MESIEEILKGKDGPKTEPTPEPVRAEEQPPETAAPATGEPEVKAETVTDNRPRDEKGRFAPKAETQPQTPPAAAPPAAKAEPDHVPRAALLDERTKRQRYEQENADLRRQLDQFLKAQQPQQQPPKAPDFFEDPNAYRNHLEQSVEDRFVNLSVAYAKRAHADFDDVMRVWPEILQANPTEYRKAVDSGDPGGYAYEACKRHIAMKEIGDDPISYRDRLAEQLLSDEQFLAKVRAKLEVAPPAANPAPTPTPSLPPSLATARNAGPRTGPTWSGPAPISQILKR